MFEPGCRAYCRIRDRAERRSARQTAWLRSGSYLLPAPVTDKQLLELSVTWSRLPTTEARIA